MQLSNESSGANGGLLLKVLVNDTLNGNPAVAADVTTTFVSATMQELL
jgi:hypothetical protein